MLQPDRSGVASHAGSGCGKCGFFSCLSSEGRRTRILGAQIEIHQRFAILP